jgi:phosphoglycerate dehydrogenase-like enzyme
VQLLGVGVDGLLPSPDLSERVEVGCARGLFAAEAAEHAVALVLALCRDLPELVDDQRAGRFRQRPAPTVAGKTAVVLGLGAIGARVARALAALEMNVVGVCRRPRAVRHVSVVLGSHALDDALRQADYLVVTPPLTPETRGCLDARALALLPRGGRVVCISRGGIVDEDALVAALDRGDLAGAALDVFEREPLPPDSPLWSAPGLLVTPHVAGLGERYVERCVELLLDNVRRLERDEPRTGLVDRRAGY